MSKKTYAILLNVEVEEKQEPERKEYYCQFKGWKHGVITPENEISFEEKWINVPYSRWNADRLQELGDVIRYAAADMIHQQE